MGLRENGNLIISHSGLRGRPGAGLDADVVEGLAGGLLTLLAERRLPRTVAVARDGRESGAALATRVIEAARGGGADVVDLGVVSTPTAKLAARRRRLGGAIIITGSHLGPDWNGIKLVAAPDYWPLDPRELTGAGSAEAETGGGLSADEGAAEAHAEALCASVDAEAVRRAGLRVSLAGGCGDAGRLVLERLGCELVSSEADVGLVLDGDGDRLELIDEDSNPIASEATLPLAAIALGAKRVVKGADTSRIVDLLAPERGWEVRATPPGELHLLRALGGWEADVAGEGNGGVVVPAVGMARDGLAAAVSVLALLAARDTSISALAAALPRRALRRANLPCADPDAAADALAGLGERMGAELGDPADGLTIERPPEGWALVRQSASEPVLRVTVEAGDETVADRLYDEVLAALPPDSG